MTKKENFNIIIAGVGGQGLITLIQIIAETALLADFDVKTSELHGLSQRGGSVETHVRFGEKVYSPLVPSGEADLILGLESQECLKAAYYAGTQTTFLINRYQKPILGEKTVHEKEINKLLKGNCDEIIWLPASQLCKDKIGKEVTAGMFLLSYASLKDLIPLKPKILLKGMQKAIPQRYFALNKKTFELTEEYLKEGK